MNIETRIGLLRCCADVAKEPKIATLFNETALVLEAMTTQYNRLHAAVRETLRENADLAEGDACVLGKLKREFEAQGGTL